MSHFVKYTLHCWQSIFFFSGICAGRPTFGILWAADIGNWKLPRPACHGRVLWRRRWRLFRSTAAYTRAGVGRYQVQHAVAAVLRSAAVQHAFPDVPARVSEPATAATHGGGIGSCQNGWRNYGHRRSIQLSSSQFGLAPLFIRKRHQPRARRQFVHAGWRFSRSPGLVHFLRRQFGITIFVQLDRKSPFIYLHIKFYYITRDDIITTHERFIERPFSVKFSATTVVCR